MEISALFAGVGSQLSQLGNGTECDFSLNGKWSGERHASNDEVVTHSSLVGCVVKPTTLRYPSLTFDNEL